MTNYRARTPLSYLNLRYLPMRKIRLWIIASLLMTIGMFLLFMSRTMESMKEQKRIDAYKQNLPWDNLNQYRKNKEINNGRYKNKDIEFYDAKNNKRYVLRDQRVIPLPGGVFKAAEKARPLAPPAIVKRNNVIEFRQQILPPNFNSYQKDHNHHMQKPSTNKLKKMGNRKRIQNVNKNIVKRIKTRIGKSSIRSNKTPNIPNVPKARGPTVKRARVSNVREPAKNQQMVRFSGKRPHAKNGVMTRFSVSKNFNMARIPNGRLSSINSNRAHVPNARVPALNANLMHDSNGGMAAMNVNMAQSRNARVSGWTVNVANVPIAGAPAWKAKIARVSNAKLPDLNINVGQVQNAKVPTRNSNMVQNFNMAHDPNVRVPAINSNMARPSNSELPSLKLNVAHVPNARISARDVVLYNISKSGSVRGISTDMTILRRDGNSWTNANDLCQKPSTKLETIAVPTPLGNVHIHGSNTETFETESTVDNIEMKTLAGFQKIILENPRSLVIDVGSGYGVYTVMAARMGHLVVSVEPNLSAIPGLCATVKLVNYSNTVIITNLKPNLNTRFQSLTGRAENSQFCNNYLDLDALTEINSLHSYEDVVIRISPRINNAEELILCAHKLATLFSIKAVSMPWIKTSRRDAENILKLFSKWRMSPYEPDTHQDMLRSSEMSQWPNIVIWKY